MKNKIPLIVGLVTALILVVVGFIKIYSDSSLKTENTVLILTKKTAEKIQAENKKVEDAVGQMNTFVVNSFDITKAQKDPKTYFEGYLKSLDPEVKSVSEKTDGSVGGYITFNVDLYKGVYEMWYGLENGKFVLQENEPLSLFYPDNEDLVWYFAPMEKKKALWTDIYYDKMLLVNCVSFVEPIIKDGVLIGMTGMDTSFKTREDMINTLTVSKNGYAFMFDNGKNLIVKPKTSDAKINEYIDMVVEKSQQQLEGVLSEGAVFIGYQKLSNGHTVVLIVPKGEQIIQ